MPHDRARSALPMPTGTVTFLFTDIEGSTTRWEHQPEQMQAALSRHDDLLRQAMQANNGYVFKTMGDAFCAAFSSPTDALQAALSAQVGLHAQQWPQEIGGIKVRMALHTGVVAEQGGDYFGQPLNRVARLLSAGHGGQVLLSDPIFALVRDNLPKGVTMLDLGEHRLKDLTRPERIFQVAAPGLASGFPPLKTLDNHPNNLPPQPTALIGRATELEALAALVSRSDVRLVTLTGPGGTGKTRLALQVAADLLNDYADGSWFVELAALTDPNLVPSTIATTLGITEKPGEAIIDTFKAALRDKQMLLVLDNFEQVTQAAPQIGQILLACPAVKVVTTSRVPLRVRGEREYPVPPLSVPDTHNLPPLERMTQYEAVRLFIERATDIKPDFQVTNDNAPAVAEICARLDGLPLAIELAAARTRLFPPQALLGRLSSRLKLLTGGAKDLPARQQTLRSAIEWSYDLLDDGEKQLFRRMSVFQGGRTLEALEAVCNYDGQLKVDVLEGVESLVSNSLLQQREGRDGEPRFWMLETIHEYARDKLQESGEAETFAKEHALYFMALAEQAEPELLGASQVEWLNRLEEEHDNLRAALRWASEHSETEIGLRLAGAIWMFWRRRGYWTEGLEQFSFLLLESAEQPSSLARAKALYGAGDIIFRQRKIDSARSRFEECLRVYQLHNDKKGIAFALNGLGNTGRTPEEKRAFYEQSLAIRREIDDRHGIAGSLGNIAAVVNGQGDAELALRYYEESMAILRELGNRGALARMLNSVDSIPMKKRDYRTARAFIEEALAIARELEDKLEMRYALTGLAQLEVIDGNLPTARALIEEAIQVEQDLGEARSWVATFDLAQLELISGNLPTARSLLEEILDTQRKLEEPKGVAFALLFLGFVFERQEDLDRAKACFAEALAYFMDEHDTENTAVCLVGYAAVANHRAEVERAARLVGAAHALSQATGGLWWPMDIMEYDRAVALAQSQLDEAVWQAAWEEGQAMSMEQAIAYALEDSTQRD